MEVCLACPQMYILLAISVVMLYKGVVSTVTWSYFHSGGYTAEGRVHTTWAQTLSHCAVQCFVYPQCEVFGYVPTYRSCLLHTGTLSTNTSLTSTNYSIDYYIATCGPKAGYFYINSLGACVGPKWDRLEWDDAVMVCEQDDAQLMYAKTPTVLDYLKAQSDGGQHNFWVGGCQSAFDPTVFEWLTGEIINSTNGGQFWLYNRPEADVHATRACIETGYSASKDQFGMNDTDCNSTRKFFCELEHF